ncbi:MAG TPA: oligopeptide/dipeptide ABC transporter ATP-binding protein [Anaerolineales bacterium]|nr:oligopeptide/dipeptide ABC transporter ATP-binding protein [Anaerolineales bacterium]
MSDRTVLISVRDLKKYFPITRGAVLRRQVGAIKAVNGVSFDILTGETLGLVGESGCGKTTVGRTILQLYRPTSGSVLFKGIDLTMQSGLALRQLRVDMQIIFQDPYASLNPRWTISRIVGEPLRVHHIGNREEQRHRVEQLLDLVNLEKIYFNRYPHELSGGQRQRVGIARALASNPQFIVCDEPITALDVSIQAQVVNLLEELQDHLKLTYLFIAHDLSMVRHLCDRVAVMYLGGLVELASRQELYTNSLHPYTQALLSAVPLPDPLKTRARQRVHLRGELRGLTDLPAGCRFHPRCPLAEDECCLNAPAWREAETGHWVACHKMRGVSQVLETS